MNGWLILLLGLGIVLVTGIRLLRTPSSMSPEKRKRVIASWQKAKAQGPFGFIAIHAAPFALGYSVLAPIGRAWSETGRFGYAMDSAVLCAIVGVGASALGAWLHWRGLQETAQRLSEE
jgi:Zn-dependent protease